MALGPSTRTTPHENRRRSRHEYIAPGSLCRRRQHSLWNLNLSSRLEEEPLRGRSRTSDTGAERGSCRGRSLLCRSRRPKVVERMKQGLEGSCGVHVPVPQIHEQNMESFVGIRGVQTHVICSANSRGSGRGSSRCLRCRCAHTLRSRSRSGEFTWNPLLCRSRSLFMEFQRCWSEYKNNLVVVWICPYLRSKSRLWMPSLKKKTYHSVLPSPLPHTHPPTPPFSPPPPHPPTSISLHLPSLPPTPTNPPTHPTHFPPPSSLPLLSSPITPHLVAWNLLQKAQV